MIRGVLVLLGEGAQPGVAFGEPAGVGGVAGVAGRDDRGAFLRHGGEPAGLLGVAGVLAGVAAEHEPVVGRGVLAVVSLGEPAAAHRQQPGVRVGDVAPRPGLPVPGLFPLPLRRGGLRLGGGLGLQCFQAGAGLAGLLAGAGPAGGRVTRCPAARRACQSASTASSAATAASSRSCAAAAATAAGGRPGRPRCRPPAPAGRPFPARGRRRPRPPARLPARAGRPAPARPATADPVPVPCPRPAAGRCRAARPCPRPRPRRPSWRPPSPAPASLRSPASVRLASFDALAAILTPSPATTESRPSPAHAHTRRTR